MAIFPVLETEDVIQIGDKLPDLVASRPVVVAIVEEVLGAVIEAIDCAVAI